MLITEDGHLAGAISGGCLEGDALKKAQLVIFNHKPMLVTYDTTDEDEGFGIGLGCNGIITILIEPIDYKDIHNPIALFKAFFCQRTPAVLISLYHPDKNAVYPGTSFLYTNHELTGNPQNELLSKQLKQDAEECLRSGSSTIKSYNSLKPSFSSLKPIYASPEHLPVSTGSINVFYQQIQPSVSLLVFGAGNDTIPISQFADVLGWETSIIDGRPNYATKERFPLAKQIIVSKPQLISTLISPDARTIALLMTHNYQYDFAILARLLPYNLPYIGILGPKKKLNKMKDELYKNTMITGEEDLANIYGPAGLDIGAESPEEIALSIISEIKTVLSKKDATSLKVKNSPIHQ
jgi:xanthine/CO dehydrogenase XdhC/CoxF family maturation factor